MDSALPASIGHKSENPAPSRDEVDSHLHRLLASPAFRSSKRCQRFLQYTVAQVLEGRGSTLKERTLAIEVFDRAASWDAGDDTIVRVGAREVRKRLAQFYSTPEGAAENLRLDLPLGSYVPEFIRSDVAQTSVVQTAEVPLPAPPVVPPRSVPVVTLVPPTAPKRQWGRTLAMAGLCCALAVLAFFGWRTYQADHLPRFNVFWAPFFHTSEPVIVAIAHPLVYSPSSHAYQLEARQDGPPDAAKQRPLRLPPSALTGADFVPQPDQYLAFGDAVAASNLQMILAKNGTESHLRFASKVEFADFRDSPVVMIGGFSNRWTMEVTQRFRFHFGFDAHWVPAILDSKNPNVSWSISQKKDDGTSPEDFFLICRLPNSQSGNAMVIGAGVAQFGTEAAGRFLASPQHMNEVLQGLPANWAHHNVELVLHARVIGNSPAAPELVRSYIW